MTFWQIVAVAFVLFIVAAACLDLVLTDRANAKDRGQEER